MVRFDDITFKEAFRYWPLILVVVSISFKFTERVGALERRSQSMEEAQGRMLESLNKVNDRLDDVIWLSKKQARILKDGTMTLSPSQIRVLRRYGEQE